MTDGLSKPERAATAALGWREAYIDRPDKMAKARATLLFLNQLAEIYGPYPVPDVHDPISGEFIPASQDAELERRGREMTEGQDDVRWVLRTWRDVRAGDTIRMPGTEHTARVVDTNAPGGNNWHVHPAADPYHPERSQADWTEICVRLEGRTDLLSFNPAGPIEIELAPSEVAAIELLGWDNRLSVKEER